jgi:bla regulator protein BlaR1
VNHLWQSTLFAVAAWLLTLAVRKNNARTRHAIWLAASLKFLIPFSLFISAGTHLQWSNPPAPSPRVTRAVQQISQPFTSPAQSTPAPATAAPTSLLPAIWFCGFAGVLCFWFIRWSRVQSVVRAATPIDVGAPVVTMSSPALLEPGVFGIFRPVLLLPEGIFERLTPHQLQAILAHELCHVRRRDNLAAAIHMIVESIFWFHPLVWWIGARLVEERERACDEEVLRQGSEPQVYAEGILNVCKFYIESPVSCVSGVTGSNLKKRIETIMTHRIVRSIGFGKRLMLATAGCIAIVLPVAIGVLSAQSPATRPQFEVASVKLNTSGGSNALFGSHSPGTFNADNFPLSGLIAGAYGVQSFQIAGAPGWIESSRYDIVAKPSVNPVKTPRTRDSMMNDQEEMKLMLQSLLEERFQLRLHRETKELPVYALTVAKGGLKLQAASCTEYDPNNPPPRPAPGQKRPDFCGNLGAGGSGPTQTMDAFGITMTQFLGFLPNYTGRVVIDKTGFTAKFNAHLVFERDPAPGPGAKGDPENRPAQIDSSVPSLFTAIEEQLGLKLESTKGPVEVLVIDRIERPSEN